MAEDIKVPGLGNLDKKYVIWGVVAGVGIGVIVYFRARSKAQSAAASDTSGASGQVVTDPAGNTCTTLDPNSGYCPGSPEDVAYQESLSGSYSGLGYNGGEFGGGTGVSLAGLLTDPAGNQCVAVNPATGYCPGSPQDLQATSAAGTGSTGSAGGITTNTDWINEALGILPGDSTSNQTALASVLGGLTVTTAQKNVFMEAIGIIGQPPQGYPQPIKTSDTAAQPGGAGAAGGTKYAANPPANLRLVHNGKNGVQVQWNPVKGATKYNVHTPGRTPLDFTTANTIANIGGLKAGTHYSIEVWADPTPTGGPHASLSFTTTKLWPLPT